MSDTPDPGKSTNDPIRDAYVTIHVGVPGREQARAVSRDARADGWRGTFYVDPAQWVVRLVRSAAPTPEFIEDTRRYVEQLAERHDGEMLGVTIEDPLRVDSWNEFAPRTLEPVDEAEAAATWPTDSDVPSQRPVDDVTSSRGA